MAINRYVKKAGMLVGMLGIIAGCFQGYRAYAEDVTQKTPPEKVNITVHKLMYDQSTQLNVDIDGIKNDGYTHDQYPTGVTKYNKADYGDVEFTLGNITDQVLPREDSDLTNAKVKMKMVRSLLRINQPMSIPKEMYMWCMKVNPLLD